MPRISQDKGYTNFLGGFVTEATGLTFPENTARDVDNCDIELKGLIRRRLGIAQETDGVVIGEGALNTTTYANNTGGPLSANPYIAAETITASYDGTTTTDWTFIESANGIAEDNNPNNGYPAPCFLFGSTQGNYGAMNQDVDVQNFDYFELSWESREITDNECPLSVGIGVTSAGIGEFINFERTGIYLASYSGRTLADRTNNTQLFGGWNYESDRSKITISGAKLSAGNWLLNITTRNGAGGIVNSTQVEYSSSDSYIEFRVASGQSHTGKHIVDNVNYTFRRDENLGDTGLTTVEAGKLAISKHLWTNVAGVDGKNWVVFQIGNRLFFRDIEDAPISSTGGTVPSVTPSLSFDGTFAGVVYNVTAAEAAQVKLQSAVGNGRIWFTSKAVVPFYAEYDPTLDRIVLVANGYQAAGSSEDDITGTRRIRDFNGVPDDQLNDEKLATIDDRHAYNLLNQGWTSEYINDYFAAKAVYPSNAQQWTLGRDTNGDFDPNTLDKQDFGNSLAPRGKYIIDALIGDKDGITHTITNLDSPIDFLDAYDEKSTTGWTAVGFFAGRVWYAGDTNVKRPNGVYFSKVLQSPRDSGTFMQENDPTSEHFSDLLATDGGVIYIPEADQILKLVPYASGLLVMAKNGIWMVYGGEGGFTATNFSVEKVSSTGIISADTTIETDQAVVFWAANGIHIVQLPERGVIPVVVDVSQTKVFEYYNKIPVPARRNATGCFDRITKKVFWFWLDDISTDVTNLYNRCLIFDTRTAAYTKYSFAVDLENEFGIAGAFPSIEAVTGIGEEIVVDDGGDVVVDDDGNIVTTDDTYDSIYSLQTSIILLFVDSTDNGLRLGLFNNRRFHDFVGFTNYEESHYESYVVTGDETLGDLQRYKQGTYLHSMFNRTENGLIPDDNDNLVLANPSGCKVVARWDWHNSIAGERWSDEQNAYRYRRPYVAETQADTVDTGEEIVYSKLKIRGKGRALTLRYSSMPCKDFQLLGYSVAFTANGV